MGDGPILSVYDGSHQRTYDLADQARRNQAIKELGPSSKFRSLMRKEFPPGIPDPKPGELPVTPPDQLSDGTFDRARRAEFQTERIAPGTVARYDNERFQRHQAAVRAGNGPEKFEGTVEEVLAREAGVIERASKNEGDTKEDLLRQTVDRRLQDMAHQ